MTSSKGGCLEIRWLLTRVGRSEGVIDGRQPGRRAGVQRWRTVVTEHPATDKQIERHLSTVDSILDRGELRRCLTDSRVFQMVRTMQQLDRRIFFIFFWYSNKIELKEWSRTADTLTLRF